VEPIGLSIAQVIDEVEPTRRESEGYEGFGGVAQRGATSDLSGSGGCNDDEAVLYPLTWPKGADHTSQEIAGLLHVLTLVLNWWMWRCYPNEFTEISHEPLEVVLLADVFRPHHKFVAEFLVVEYLENGIA
jgi:hypothetical protein